MTIDVLRLPGDYKIVTQPGGTLTLNVGSTSSNGVVVITGNLDVKGTTTQIESVNATIKDSTIMLNQGEPSVYPYNKVTVGTSGLQISRGTYSGVADSVLSSAFIEWNEDYTWTVPSSPNLAIDGIFEFRVGPTYSAAQYGAIKVNAIRIDPATAPRGNDGNPRLNFFGSNIEQENAVMSVAGSGNYAARVTDNDDIPNKKYVDDTLLAASAVAEAVIDGHSYIKINDNYKDTGVSEIFAVLDGNPDDSKTNITTGTKIMSLTAASAIFNQVQFINNAISALGTNTNLILTPNGTGTTIITSPILLQTNSAPSPGIGQTAVYSNTPGGGGTGIYFVNNTAGQNTRDEFVSRKKAIIISLIF